MIAKFRITLQSFDYKLLNTLCQKIIEAFKIAIIEIKDPNSKLLGPVPLPKKLKRFCVLRSPHVNKDSREHFELIYYKRFIDIETNSAFVAERILGITIPPGVYFTAKKI
jgi:small subunit ribosomal protein S10